MADNGESLFTLRFVGDNLNQISPNQKFHSRILGLYLVEIDETQASYILITITKHNGDSLYHH